MILYATISPRTSLKPLIPPPVELDDYPTMTLPIPNSTSPFIPGYQVSTHVFPAAYPRCPSNVWVPPPVEETTNERRARIACTVAELGAMKEAQEQGRDDRAPRGEVLWMVAKRYVKTPRPQAAGLTLVLLHGVGALKEVCSLFRKSDFVPHSHTKCCPDMGANFGSAPRSTG